MSNAVLAMPSGALMEDLAATVANDGSPDTAAAWLLSFASDFLAKEGLDGSNPWRAYDLFVVDFEAVARIWPAFRASADAQPIPASFILPALARFLIERLPGIWRGQRLRPVPAITAAVALADRIDTLVGLFAAGLKPNGSKDPFALRRAAKEVLQMICFPIVMERNAA